MSDGILFKIYKTDFGFSKGGVDYRLKNVDVVAYENPKAKHVVRGRDASDEEGLVYSENFSQPYRITITTVGLPASYADMFNSMHDDEERGDFWCIDRKNGMRKTFVNALISAEVDQQRVEEGEDSLKITISLESFKIENKRADEADE